MANSTTADETVPVPDQSGSVQFWRIRRWQLLAVAAIALAAIGYWQANQPRDYRTALANGYYRTAEKLALREAEAGDLNAQNALGNLYYLGLGVERDYSRAAHWYLKAALAGNTNSQINISHLYRLGQGVPRDKLRALGWLSVARRGKNERAEGHIKWQSVRLQMSLSQLEFVHKHYNTAESLDPAHPPPAGQ